MQLSGWRVPGVVAMRTWSVGDVASNHVIGWVALFATYAVVPLLPVFRGRWHLIGLVWVLLTAHHAVALINTFVFTVPLAGQDARGFYMWGVYSSVGDPWRFGVGAMFYKELLAGVFRLVGPSHLLAHQLSIFMFLFSCAVLARIVELLGAARYTAPTLFVYAFWPASLILFSIPMREAYQTLFFMLAVYLGLRYHLEKPRRAIHLGGALVSALVMGLFHKGLIVYAVFLVPLLLFWPIRDGRRPEGDPVYRKHRLYAAMALLVAAVGLTVISVQYRVTGTNIFRYVITGEIVGHVVRSRQKALERSARTYYGGVMDLSSPVRAVTSTSAIVGHYLFAPYPSQIERRADLLVAMESWARMLLLVIVAARWFRARGSDRSIITFMMAIYFSIAFVWAMGTNNFGTSLRHNQTHNWILCALAVPILAAWMERGVRRLAARGSSGS